MIILLFKSIHDVLRAEKALNQAGIHFDLIPTPKEYSRQCGMSIEVDRAIGERAKAALSGMHYQAVP